MNELVSRVQAASANQPDWLKEKRQLAATLLARFSTSEEAQPFIDAWQQQIDTSFIDEQAAPTIDGLVNLPLAMAVQQYPSLCQENLMEKGLFWQASQLNALHLALLNGSRFLYLPNDQQVNSPVTLTGDLAATNYHTLIIVGSNSQLTIKDQRNWHSDQPLFTGIELLVGANSTVSYIYNGHLQGPQTWFGLHAYQAYGAQLRVMASPQVTSLATVDLQSNLDGDDSRGTVMAVHAAANGPYSTIVGVNDHQVGGHYQPQHQRIAAGDDQKITISKVFAGDGES